MDKYPEYPFGADLPPVEKRMVRPVIPENTLPLRPYLHTQNRYAALPPVGTRIGQTIGNRIHFGSNAITCQYTSLDNVPQPRYSGIHRRRNYCQKTRHRRHVLRRRSHKTGILPSHHTGNRTRSAYSSRLRNHRPIHRADGTNDTPSPRVLALDPQPLETPYNSSP